MKRRFAALLLAAGLAALLSAGIAAAQDLSKTYALPAGGKVVIKNISGDIKVSGYGGIGIVVDAKRVGRDRDLVKVEDLSSGDRIELRVQYPENCNCDAGVNFDILVPASIPYNFDSLASVSGNVDVSGINGRLSAKSVSGNVSVRGFTGVVSASSVSGDVDAEIVRLEGTGDMKFTSVSGGARVRAPLSINAEIEMSSISGSLETDFPITIQEPKSGPGRSARGRMGAGGTSLRLSSVSGSVSLTRS